MTLASKTFLVTILFYIIFFILLGSPFIFGDGYGYFHVAENISEKFSFISKSEPAYLEYSKHAVTNFNDAYVTVYTPGPSLAWVPLLLFDNDSLNEKNDYFKAFNGHSLYEGLVPLVTSVIFSFLSLVLIYKVLRNLNFSEKITLFSVFAIHFSSFSLGYVFTNSSYSHTYEFFYLSGMLYFLTKYGKTSKLKNLFWAGFFGGLLVLTRVTGILILIGTFYYIFKQKNLKKFGVFALGGIIFMIIYLVYNKISYDYYFANSYNLIWDQSFDFSKFYLFEILFSNIRGWFIWSPVMIFGLLGIFLYSRKSLIGFMQYISPALTTILLYSFWPVWWAGDSIGQRFFLVLAPFMAIGLAHLLRKIQSYGRKVFLTFLFFFFILTIYSFSLLFLHRFTPTDNLVNQKSQVTDSKYDYIPEAERFSAFDIYNYHFDLLKTAESPKSYLDSLTENLTGGRSLAMIYLGFTKPLVKTEYIIQNRDQGKVLIYVVADPVKHRKTIDINLALIKSGVIVKRLVIPVSDTSINQTFSFECNPKNCQLETSNLNVVEFKADTEINLNQKHLITINEDTQMEIAVNENAKLINK